MKNGFFTLVMLLTALSTGCRSESPSTAPTAPAVSQAAAPGKTEAPTSNVAKIVFVGQKDACECTRERVAGSWAALEKALSGRTDIAVEKIDLDVEKAKAAAYQKLGAIMVVPAIYVLDSSGALIEMLQGEIASDQILVAIGG